MNIESIIYRLKSVLYSRFDHKVKRKIIVIESDDWGSIRVPSRKDYDDLMAEGYAMDKRPYERYDTLETDEDIKALSAVLCKYRDFKGRHPIITFNFLSANPDFIMIKKDDYRIYHYEDIVKTYTSNEKSKNVMALIRKGISDGLFMPQCHGREHFNVIEWMRALQNKDKDALVAFNHKMCGIFPKENPALGNQYMIAFKAKDEKAQRYVCETVAESLRMFEKTWGFKSKTFIAPCYTWNDRIENMLYTGGVRLLQGSRIRRSSSMDSGNKFVYMGQKSNGMVCSVRNCYFEPATNRNYSTEQLMKEIDVAFSNNHVAIISSHRINYVGGIDVSNRTKNLRLLDDFLSGLLKKYPDVEFMSSDQLIEILK